jgi:hypothetical protein
LQAYLKERRPEIQELNAALKSGDVAAAQQAYHDLIALGNKVLGKDNPFLRGDRALDFNAIGAALQNGDLTGAQAAFAALQSTFVRHEPSSVIPPTVSPDATVDLSHRGV